MKCELCNKSGVRVRRITRSYGQGEELLVIENIPAIRCPACGESYFTADTLHEIERIKLHRKNFSDQRSVSVAEFARTA